MEGGLELRDFGLGAAVKFADEMTQMKSGGDTRNCTRDSSGHPDKRCIACGKCFERRHGLWLVERFLLLGMSCDRSYKPHDVTAHESVRMKLCR